MNGRTLLHLLIGLAAGYAGYYVYTRSGLVSGIIALLAVAWLLYRFSSAENAWDTLEMLTQPPAAAFIFFLAGFTFFASRGTPFTLSLLISIGLALIGAVTGMFLYKYWDIGEP